MSASGITVGFSELVALDRQEREHIWGQLKPELQAMKKARGCGYQDPRASINLMDDAELFQEVQALKGEIETCRPTLVVVVGIGGSNLGTMAVQEAIQGRLRSRLQGTPRILYADTVDSDAIGAIYETIESELARGGTVVINGISKSGGTTETIANFEVLVDALEKYGTRKTGRVVVTTDADSRFADFARSHGWAVLQIPQRIGGRFSVFSAVGMFPLALMGIDVEQLRAGARDMRERCLAPQLEDNPAAHIAAILWTCYQRKRIIADLFLFDSNLESIGKWFRQLLAESLGKEYDVHGQRVQAGLTPTVSIGSTDLHSMAQLYLGGPQDKITTFVEVRAGSAPVRVPNRPEYEKLVPGLQGHSLAEIMHAILEGTRLAFVKAQRPFVSIVLPRRDEYCIGQFMQLQMQQVMYLARLLAVNPFDQPHVELYKSETRQILAARESSG